MTDNERYYAYMLRRMREEDDKMAKKAESLSDLLEAASYEGDFKEDDGWNVNDFLEETFHEIDRLDSKDSYYERAIEVLEECGSLMASKGVDYQGGSVKDDDYYPHGWRSFDTMLTTKVLRFRSVMEQKGSVNFDTADDCLRDLINYAARAIVWMERNK